MMPRLTPTAGALLVIYACEHGLRWKRDLRVAWMMGASSLPEELRMLRFSHGRGWLNSVRLGSLQQSEVG